jgi:hypothetical protein
VVAGDGPGQPATEELPGPAETGARPDPSWRLSWRLAAVAVVAPTAAGGLFGFLLAVTIQRHRSADMALPPWLYPAAWGTGITALAIAVILAACLWVGKPWRAAADSGWLRLAITSLTITGLLCCLASVLVPS